MKDSTKNDTCNGVSNSCAKCAGSDEILLDETDGTIIRVDEFGRVFKLVLHVRVMIHVHVLNSQTHPSNTPHLHVIIIALTDDDTRTDIFHKVIDKSTSTKTSSTRTRAANIKLHVDREQFRGNRGTLLEALLYYFGPDVIGFCSIFPMTLVLLYLAFEELPWIALNVCGYYPMGIQSRISLCLFGKYTKKKQPVRVGKSTGMCTCTCTSTKGEKTKGVVRKRGIGRFVLNPLMLMSLFWASMVSVVNGFTPEDNAAFNSAKSSCLSETSDGSCPTFAASNDATGIPYGVIGDWDMSKVTSLQYSMSTPPLFCLLSLGSFT